jgi:single-stranded-DNA-specific exonuclease
MLGAICFCATTDTFPIQVGDVVDVAFQPQVNEFRGVRSAQLNIQDIRPHCEVPCGCDATAYRRLRGGHATKEDLASLLPERKILAAVWKYLISTGSNTIKESPMCLCRKIVRRAQLPLDLGQLLTCLDIFSEVELLTLERQHKYLIITLAAPDQKADLNASPTMRLLQGKES